MHSQATRDWLGFTIGIKEIDKVPSDGREEPLPVLLLPKHALGGKSAIVRYLQYAGVGFLLIGRNIHNTRHWKAIFRWSVGQQFIPRALQKFERRLHS